jgi:RTX calcium-binding nonapeptide repeat (4 copies)
MARDVGGSARRAAIAAALALVGALAAPPAAGAVAVNLHVEAGGSALAPGDGQVARSISTTTAHNARCSGSGQSASITGATPLGALVAARYWRPDLEPLEISDQFSFGLFLCSAGGFFGSSNAFWLYKVNHVSPETGGDSFRVHTGDDVLWFFENTETGENTGDELAIDAPARARPGEVVQVSVSAFSFDGKRKPAAGATVGARGGGRATADAVGRAQMTISQEGYLGLRASLGSDIPSPVLKICVDADLARCAPERGNRIYGTALNDRVSGTPGRDVIRTGAGDDVINVRGGRLDRVYCGPGTDLVRASRKDHVAGDCEKVRRR